MIDQATKLRELVKQQHIDFESNEPKRRALKTVAVTSGKGGVGKTSVVTNLGLLCAIWGYRVAIFDADLSLANVDMLLGIRPHYNLSHVISGEKKLQDILAKGPNGIILIPASCGIDSLANLTSTQMERLLNDLEQFASLLDFLFIDTGAGVSDNVLPFVLAASETIIVTTPEPTAITDAYAMIKIITQRRRRYYGQARNTLMTNGDERSLKLLVNMVNSSMEAEDVMERILLVIKRFLNTTVEFGGYILKDDRVGEAIMTQTPLVISSPHSKASKCIVKIAKQIADFPAEGKAKDFFSEAIKQSELND